MMVHVPIVLAVCVGLLGVIRSDEVPQHYCGRRLSNALAILCEHGLIMKRDVGSAFHRRQPAATYEMPWIPEQHAKIFLNTRRKRQIVDECCIKPCLLEKLLAYCAP